MSFQTKLSVNINKIATLRNARGKNIPDLLEMTKIILESGAHGITVHPRPDQRHIRYEDIAQLKRLMEKYPKVEFNIEGYPSKYFLKLIQDYQPHQCTLVPDPPEVLTSNAGWAFKDYQDLLIQSSKDLRAFNVRSSLFLDPFSMNEEAWISLKSISPDRIELYTEAYAENYNTPKREKIISEYQQAALKATNLGLKINAGHDLNQNNLFYFLKAIPEITEVSIGQALISESLKEGLNITIKKYLDILS
ncbi:MAG: pyridoxine 5'-phosphate synthase [Bdellovibrionales bacterium]